MRVFESPAVDWWVLSPQIVLVGAALGLLLASSLAPRRLPDWVSTAVSVATGTAVLLVAAIQWDSGGNVPRPTLAGAFVSDGFSLLFTALVGAGVVLTALVAHSALSRYDMAPPEFSALLLASAAGAVVMAGANDLIVLFLGLESLSIALYVLIALAGRRATARESAMKYFVLGAFSSAFFLYGIALVYGSTGSTNLSRIGAFLDGHELLDEHLLLAGIGLLLVGLAFKVAAVPFHFWAPDVYQGAPSPVTGYLASIAKAAGFAALIRVLLVAFDSHRLAWTPIVVGLAFATLAVGAVMAITQTDVKRMLAFSSISHAGFVLVGVSAAGGASGQWIATIGDEAPRTLVQSASDGAISSAVFYLVAYSFMALGSFAVMSVIGSDSRTPPDSDPDAGGQHSFARYGGLAKRRPVLALAFTVLLLAQAGVPLTSGFIAKFEVIRAAVEAEGYVLAAVAMGTAVVSAFAYLRVVLAMYSPEAAAKDDDVPALARAARPRWGGLPRTSVLAIAIAVAVTIIVGALPQTLLEWSSDAVLSWAPALDFVPGSLRG